MSKKTKNFNVAVESTAGHFLAGFTGEVNTINKTDGIYSFNVEGPQATLTTSNHGAVNIGKYKSGSYGVITQSEFDPYAEVFRRNRD